MEELINQEIQYQIYTSINHLGIERTLETIECICNPVLRARLRIGYFDYLKKSKE